MSQEEREEYWKNNAQNHRVLLIISEKQVDMKNESEPLQTFLQVIDVSLLEWQKAEICSRACAK